MAHKQPQLQNHRAVFWGSSRARGAQIRSSLGSKLGNGCSPQPAKERCSGITDRLTVAHSSPGSLISDTEQQRFVHGPTIEPARSSTNKQQQRGSSCRRVQGNNSITLLPSTRSPASHHMPHHIPGDRGEHQHGRRKNTKLSLLLPHSHSSVYIRCCWISAVPFPALRH